MVFQIAIAIVSYNSYIRCRKLCLILKYLLYFQLKCEFVKGPNNRVTCPSFPEIHYDQQTSDQHQHNCAIIVQNIQEHHEGNWRCEFEIDVPAEDRDGSEPVIIQEKVSLVARGYRYI